MREILERYASGESCQRIAADLNVRRVSERSLLAGEVGAQVIDSEPSRRSRGAAWVLAGGAEPPEWPLSDVMSTEAEPTPHVRERYASVRDLTAERL